MYQKFEDIFSDYYRDTSNKIGPVPAFDAMDLTNALLLKISLEVGFRTPEVQDYAKTKALVKTLRSEVIK